MQPDVEFTELGDVAYLTLRGPRMNSVARAMHHALAAQLDHVRTLSHIRFVVLRGADGVFSSGGDLNELAAGLPDDYVEDYRTRMDGTIRAITEMGQIVVSVIEGAAIGAAAALAMSADLVLCARSATIRLSFVHVGYAPDAGATFLLPELAGAVGRDILLTGRLLPADEAQAHGLVSRVCEDDDVDQALEELLDELRLAPAHALGLTKRLMRGRSADEYLAAVYQEGETQPLAAAEATPDLIEAVLERARLQRDATRLRADTQDTPTADQGRQACTTDR
ncbi:enoyl-CoA hydratase/isomerase family protein [Microbacterium sp. zg.Y909]|uniref:enoyl-CoA hydratase/isomerase family protein n=1 Tax=Microbacterium sp. zg.Y909 TaxID=2969413 RepID=UPI0027E3A935|nr:enoyl-CoA hydratase/isomerase family protein [Microbacterium sp. zg.Y909]